MRNRIEINDVKRGATFLSAALATPDSGGTTALLRNENDPLRAPIINRGGGTEQKQRPERTSTPLKIVFIARLDSTLQDAGASACRQLAAALTDRGHRLLILEHQKSKRKLEPPAFGQTVFYESLKELKDRFTPAIRSADFVMVGSNVPDGAAIGDWVTHIAQGATAFYDLNTPVTLSRVDRGDSPHLTRSLIQRYHLYLSLTGGPLLELLNKYYGVRMVRPLYGSVNTSLFYPERSNLKWDLGYVGDFNEDRLPGLDELLLEPARHWPAGRFVVAGHGHLQCSDWPANVKRLAIPGPGKERAFYNTQRFALNVTGAEMIDAGFSPGLRIFEAAACGTPIISDYWEELETFFAPDEEILFARSAEEALEYLRGIREDERLRIGDSARRRILSDHSAEHRAIELENYAIEAMVRT
jgi:spore maturation protein CgeB